MFDSLAWKQWFECESLTTPPSKPTQDQQMAIKPTKLQQTFPAITMHLTHETLKQFWQPH